jgi:hypothetical protein
MLIDAFTAAFEALGVTEARRAADPDTQPTGHAPSVRLLPLLNRRTNICPE